METEEAFLDLIVASFEPLTPGSGGGSVVEKKEKLANTVCPGYGVLGYRGADFKGLLHRAGDPQGGGAETISSSQADVLESECVVLSLVPVQGPMPVFH